MIKNVLLTGNRFILAVLFFVFSQSAALAVNFDHTVDFDYDNLVKGQEIGCLAMNIYHEGRGESPKGRAAIAAVTMNRVYSSDYPDSVCEVVWQKKQFSWTRIADRHHVIRNLSSWKAALITAELFVNGAQLWKVGHATHYHSEDVEPYWASSQNLIGKVGSHYFYIL